jgi:type VI secretion system protein ImpH
VKETAESWAERLVEAPGRVDFFSAVDVLVEATGGAPLGASERFQDERVLLGHAPGLGFARAEVEEVKLERASDGLRARMVSDFFGLTGAVTPLPLHVAEEADRDDEHGEVVRGVLGLFHHRLLSLLHRGVRQLDYPRGFREDGRDPWSQRVLALLGASERPTSLTTAHLLRLAPVLISGVSSPQMLEAAMKIVLDDCLGEARVRCEPFTGEWMPIDPAEWSRLGSDTAGVGMSAVLGTSVMHRSGAARVVVGPLTGDNYKEFTPGGRAHARAADLLDAFLDEPLHLDMVLEIQDMTYPPARLGERHLGDDLWLARSKTSGLTTRMNVPMGRGKGAT